MMLHLRFSLRRALKKPSMTVLSVFVLTIGISLTVSMFALVKGMLWSTPDIGLNKPLFNIEWERSSNQGFNDSRIDTVELGLFKTHTDLFDHLVSFEPKRASVYNPEGQDFATQYQMADVSVDFFDMVKTPPSLGRVFEPSDLEASERVCLISHRLWQERYSSDKDIVGKKIAVNGENHTVIGVMPDGLLFPVNMDIWTVTDWPFAAERIKAKKPKMGVIAVIKEGVSVEKIKTTLKPVIESLQKEYPEANKHRSHLVIEPYNNDFAPTNVRIILTLLVSCALLVLLISCTNVSNIILANLASRQSELAIKRSLGATKKSIFFSVQMDVFVLTFISLLLSLLVSAWLCRIIWERMFQGSSNFPYWWSMEVDTGTFIFSVCAMFLALFLAGLFPALRATGNKVIDILKDDGRTSSGLFVGRFSRFLIGLQICISLALLISAISFSSAIGYLTNTKVPYDANKILQFQVSADFYFGFTTNGHVENFYTRVLEKLQAHPSIDEVAVSRSYSGMFTQQNQFQLEGEELSKDDEARWVGVDIVSENFFNVFEIKPMSGRFFEAFDTRETEQIAVVNQAFIDQFLGGENAVGKRLKIKDIKPWWEPHFVQDPPPWSGYIKVVGTVKTLNPHVTKRDSMIPLPVVYLPFKQQLVRYTSFLMRGQTDLKAQVPMIKQALSEEHRTLALDTRFETIAEGLRSRAQALYTLRAIVYSFGIAALFMASVGLYGLVSFATKQKYREFGIRMALGAGAKDIILSVFKSSRLVLIIGMLFGLAGGIFLSRILINAFSFNSIVPWGISDIVWAFVIVFILTIVAILIPSLRASQSRPSAALRYE